MKFPAGDLLSPFPLLDFDSVPSWSGDGRSGRTMRNVPCGPESLELAVRAETLASGWSASGPQLPDWRDWGQIGARFPARSHESSVPSVRCLPCSPARILFFRVRLNTQQLRHLPLLFGRLPHYKPVNFCWFRLELAILSSSYSLRHGLCDSSGAFLMGMFNSCVSPVPA